MAHLTLQLGAAVVVPIRTPRKMASGRARLARTRPERGGRSGGGLARFRLVRVAHGQPRSIGPSSCVRRRVARVARLEMRLSVPAALLVLGLLAGCATVQPVPTTVVTPGMPNPEVALRQSMQHVDAEMAELGQLTPTAAAPSTPVMPEDLQRIVSFKWNGPARSGRRQARAKRRLHLLRDRAARRAAGRGRDRDLLRAGLPGVPGARRRGRNARHRRGRSAPPPGAGDPPCLGFMRSSPLRRSSPVSRLAGRRSPMAA